MSTMRIHARSLAANWAGYVINVVIMFFLSPYIVGKLGDVRYGVWSLVITLTGYLGLVEMGVRISTGRFVNFYYGRGDLEGVSRIINVSLAFYAMLSVVAMAAAAGVGLAFGWVFPKVPPELASEAKWLLLLLAFNIWLGFFSSVFCQLLHANNRFDLRNSTDIAVLVIRSALSIWVLHAGMGMVALAIVHVGSGIFGCWLVYVLARWKGPRVHLARRYLQWATLWELMRFGIWAFVGNVSLRLVYYSSIAVIAMLLGAREITYYTFGFMLIEYGRTLAGVLPQQVLKPSAEQAAGRAAAADLRWYLLGGSRMIMILAVPILVGFIVLGKAFLVQWLRSSEFAQSAAVLTVLAVSQLWAVSSEMAKSVLQSIGQIKRTAGIVLAEAGCNIALSVALVMWGKMGIVGVALGTAIPMILFEGILLQLVACRSSGLSLGLYVRTITLRWMVAAGLLLAAGWAIAGLEWGVGWWPLAAKAALLMAVYVPIGWLVVLGGEMRWPLYVSGMIVRMFGLKARST